MGKAKKDKENVSNAKMPTEYSRSSKFAYFWLKNQYKPILSALQVLEMSCQQALRHLGMDKEKDVGQKLVLVAQLMKKLWLGGKKWDTNLQTCSDCKVRGCEMLIRTLTIYRVDRKD